MNKMRQEAGTYGDKKEAGNGIPLLRDTAE